MEKNKFEKLFLAFEGIYDQDGREVSYNNLKETEMADMNHMYCRDFESLEDVIFSGDEIPLAFAIYERRILKKENGRMFDVREYYKLEKAYYESKNSGLPLSDIQDVLEDVVHNIDRENVEKTKWR